ncbi:MAG TPA: tape measure protein [Tepidiformaceae bacterium]
MAFPTVGVLAIVEGMNSFRRDMDEVKRRMEQLGQTSQSVARQTGTLSTAMGGVGGALSAIGTIAAGILAAGAIRAIANEIKQMASEAFDAAAQLQKLEIQFNTLVARELAASNSTEGFADYLREAGAASDYQVQRFINLRNSHDNFIKKMAEVDQHTAAGRYAFEQYGNRLKWVDSQIRELIPGFDGLDNRLQQSAFGTYDFSEALKEAAAPARELLNWSLQMSVTTPFRPQTISSAISLSMAMGFQTKEIRRLITATGDYTAGMGLSDEVMQRILYNFGQMKAAGKVMGTELRDLARGAMMPVATVLEIMQRNMGLTNISLDQFRKNAAAGQYDVDQFVEAFVQMAESDFAGAMKRMSGTWAGVTQDVQDFINVILGASVLRPILDSLSKGLRGLIDSMTDEETAAKLETTRGLMSSIVTSVGGILTALSGMAGLKIEPGGFLQSFNDFLRGIAIPMAQLRALLRGDFSFDEWLQRVGFTEAQSESIKGFLHLFDPVIQGLQMLYDAAVGLGPTIKQTIDDLVAAVSPVVAIALPGVLENLGEIFGGLGKSLAATGPGILDILGKVVALLATAAIGTLDLFVTSLATLLDIANGDWAGAAENVGGFWDRFLESALSLAGETPESFAESWSWVWEAAGIISDRFWSNLQETWAANDDMLLLIVQTMIANYSERLKTDWATFLEDMLGGIDAWAGVWANLETIRLELVKRGGALIQGFWDGAKAKVAAFMTWLSGKISDILALWDKLLDIGSPSRVMVGIGKNMMAGLQKGVGEGMRGTQAAMTAAAGQQAAALPVMAGGGASTYNRTINMGGVYNQGIGGGVFDRAMRDWLGA